MNIPKFNEPVAAFAALGPTVAGVALWALTHYGIDFPYRLEAMGLLAFAISSLGRFFVDGPRTSKEKDAEVYRLQALLEKSISLEKPPPTPRSIGPAAILLLVFGVACSGAQVREAATCSPKADAWFAQELVTVCQGRVLSECPEADAIGETYEGKAELECSKQ